MITYVRLEPHPDYLGPKWARRLREDDFHVVGCVPKLSFIFSLSEVRELPSVEDWPLSTGSGDKLFEAGLDHRFILDEILKCKLSSEVFGRAFERAGETAGRRILLELKRHRRDDPTETWLNQYIAAAEQVRNRRSAHRALKEME